MKRILATAQLLLILPAALFMMTLVVRGLQPVQFEPAHTADQIIMWYAGRQWTLWVLLIGLPMTVLFIGGPTLPLRWSLPAEQRRAVAQSHAAARADVATMVLAGCTLAAAVVLAVAAVHMLMN